MNWRHLQAFIWLRWRLMYNQWRRAGAFSAALMIIIAVSLIITAIPLFVGCFGLGVYLIPKATPIQLMFVWDGLIVAFLLFWGIGVLTELQRNDPLALSKFLHLPVSVNSAFLINYLSSLLRLSLILFVPVMLGYAMALVYAQGFKQWAVLPSLAAFFLLITAPTYQFQGWLASLVNNPRKRRTVIVMVTMGFVLIFQLPNLVNLYIPRMVKKQTERQARQIAEKTKLQQSLNANEIDPAEFTLRQKEINDRYQAEREQSNKDEQAQAENLIRLVNMVLPIGWLPLGVMSAAEGQFLPSLLGLLGMILIGSASLWRSYRTTIRQFQGQSSNRQGKAPVVRETIDKSTTRKVGGKLLEIRLPWLSEPVSAIALGGFQSLLRSPEAKISLLTPIIMGGVFGSMIFNIRQAMPEQVRPLLGIAGIAMVMFGLLQIMSNQFGIDRDGFRVFVLCAASRRDILLGKNLSFVPTSFLLSAILVIAVLVICPMRIDHALGMIPQFVSMFLIFCLIANVSSIYTPVFMAPGTLKPANPKLTTVLIQLLIFLILFPLLESFTMIPVGVEALLHYYGIARGWPVYLLLALAECLGIVVLYHFSLYWQGSQLQAREQRILETVTNRAQ